MFKIKLSSLTFLLSFASIISFAQQFSTISGTITTSNGKPAPFISIGLKGKGQGTTSDANGLYTINRIKAGTYTIKASAVGIEASEKTSQLLQGRIKLSISC